MTQPPVALHALAVQLSKHRLPAYPPDHQLGMKVPKGGSNCDKCEHLAAPQKCDEPHFVYWNAGPRIPDPTAEYCCDFFDARK